MRPLDEMTDFEGARRLLLLWVPRAFSRWKVFPWGLRLGRLVIQWTPLIAALLLTGCAEKSKPVSSAEFRRMVAEGTDTAAHPEDAARFKMQHEKDAAFIRNTARARRFE